ncbi:MAG: acetyl-CoA carboxylase biotin carboxylase subunit, partial [Armatimonadetes bacterium]|nr:acetyl-CoA carboxylase biotin carboxylase subunit [Armatimonadota bacterium]
MLKKILIANRGEIAFRIIRTCRELGIIPAVIFSPVDRSSLAVKLADEAYLINLPPRETYLNFQAIINAAKKAKAEAIHPGYGFLAENSEFAGFCEKEGIVFIGPTLKIIKALGDKNQARSLMENFGLPLIPGTKKALFNLEEAEEEAKKLNYPLLIKASLGGGGRGMRKANSLQELRNFFPQARNEAKLAFGSEALYLEKYLEKPRHIEFQILADNFGNVVHLGERECSIQRRFQKIIEEAP